MKVRLTFHSATSGLDIFYAEGNARYLRPESPTLHFGAAWKEAGAGGTSIASHSLTPSELEHKWVMPHSFHAAGLQSQEPAPLTAWPSVPRPAVRHRRLLVVEDNHDARVTFAPCS